MSVVRFFFFFRLFSHYVNIIGYWLLMIISYKVIFMGRENFDF